MFTELNPPVKVSALLICGKTIDNPQVQVQNIAVIITFLYVILKQ